MGSHPRVADKRGTYDLFGPVNKLWGGGYDRAMSVFLACLKEFGDFARARWVGGLCCWRCMACQNSVNVSEGLGRGVGLALAQ
jgi:hypothetical protein